MFFISLESDKETNGVSRNKKTPLVALGENRQHKGGFIKADWIRWFATNGQVLLPLTSGAEAVETLVDVCRNVRDGKRTRQTAGPYLCPGGDFSSGQIAACCILNGFAAAIVTEWGHGWCRKVDVNWHPHTLNPPACCLQNVSFSSRAEMQTETLWEITVSESDQGQDFESLRVCFFFGVGKFEFTCSFEPMHDVYDVWWQYVV